LNFCRRQVDEWFLQTFALHANYRNNPSINGNVCVLKLLVYARLCPAKCWVLSLIVTEVNREKIMNTEKFGSLLKINADCDKYACQIEIIVNLLLAFSTQLVLKRIEAQKMLFIKKGREKRK